MEHNSEVSKGARDQHLVEPAQGGEEGEGELRNGLQVVCSANRLTWTRLSPTGPPQPGREPVQVCAGEREREGGIFTNTFQQETTVLHAMYMYIHVYTCTCASDLAFCVSTLVSRSLAPCTKYKMYM